MDDLLPSEFFLSQNYPNPFCDKTTIKYCIAYKTNVILTIYNSKGKLISKLVNEEKKAGTYEIEFNSYQLTEGNYYYRLIAGEYSNVKEMKIEE
jgi:hypothetical protein